MGWRLFGIGPAIGLFPVCFLVAGCADQARVYALDPASQQAGTPKIQFVRNGLNSGPVTVTMPNGEILHGEYQVAENSVIGVGFSGGLMTTMVGSGGGSPVVISASGPQGTIMNCDGTVDLGGHGFGQCQTSKGGKYRVMF